MTMRTPYSLRAFPARYLVLALILTSSCTFLSKTTSLAAAQASKQKVDVSYAHGKLTLNLHMADLSEVTKRIGQLAGLTVAFDDGVNEKVSLSFKDLTIEDGVSRMVRGEGSGIVFGYGVNGDLRHIAISRRAVGQTEKILKIRKISNFFRNDNMPDTLSMEDTAKLARDLQDQERKRSWGRLAGRLIDVRHPQAKPYLKQLMNHTEDYIRWESTEAFCRLVDVEDADFILELATSNDWSKRAASALIAMLLIDDNRQIPLLLSMLNDSKQSVRAGAAKALGAKKIDAAIPYLRKMLTDEELKYQAAESLQAITGEEHDVLSPEERAQIEDNARRFNEELQRIEDNK